MDAPSFGHGIAAVTTSVIALAAWLIVRRQQKAAVEPSTTEAGPRRRAAHVTALLTTGLGLGLWVLYLIFATRPALANDVFGVISTGVLVVANVINLVYLYRRRDDRTFNARVVTVVAFLLSLPVASLIY